MDSSVLGQAGRSARPLPRRPAETKASWRQSPTIPSLAYPLEVWIGNGAAPSCVSRPSHKRVYARLRRAMASAGTQGRQIVSFANLHWVPGLPSVARDTEGVWCNKLSPLDLGHDRGVLDLD